jgi:hypothetical protein
MSEMASILHMFGDLHHLRALQTVSLRFREYGGSLADTTTPAELDQVLAQARDTLKDVQIYGHTYHKERDALAQDLELLPRCLPSVAGKIFLNGIKAGQEAE